MPTNTYSQTSCDISQKLRSQRILAGLTQDELAEKANLDRKTIQRIERLRGVPTVETLFQLALALGVTPNELTPECYLRIGRYKEMQSLYERFQKLDRRSQDIFLVSSIAMIDGFISKAGNPAS